MRVTDHQAGEIIRGAARDTQSDGDFSIDVFDISASPKSAYGESLADQRNPFIDASPVYNLIPANFRSYTSAGGSTSVANSEFITQTGTTIYAYGVIRSFRSLNVQYGNGAMVRFGARFPNSVANCWQGVGLFNIGDEVSFGMSGTSFGVWHRHGGFAEVQRLTVTEAAGGAENATVTVNDVIYTVPLTSGTVQKNAHEIAAYLTANGTGFAAYQNDDDVFISFDSDGDKTGAFTFSSSTATGTFTQIKQGVTKTSDFVALADFNGKVPVNFDHTKGNQYQIHYSAGYGNINYYIFDFNNGTFLKAHTVRWQNSNTTANLTNPSMHAGVYCSSAGSTTNIATYCSHIAANVAGSVKPTRNPRSFEHTKSIGTTETAIFQIRNKRAYNGIQNQAEIAPYIITVANESNKTAKFRLVGGSTIGGTHNFQDVATNTISEADTGGTTVTGGTRLLSFTVAPGQSRDINLSSFNIRIPPTLVLTVTGQVGSGGNTADLSAALVWLEDI